jgi:membrane-associated phospholipid phosphatase
MDKTNDFKKTSHSSVWAIVRREMAWLSIPLVIAVAAWMALNVDCPISKWCVERWREKPRHLFLQDFLRIFETFGNGIGVAVILATVFVLDPARRVGLLRVMGCAYGAGLAANGLKLILARTRPYSFDYLGDVWATFGAWLPGSGLGSVGQSFPSAHTATAVGLAAGLAWLYPQGRWLFFIFAALVGCQRIQSGMHYFSDVLAGAALGSLIALAFFKCGLLPGWMDRLEGAMRKNAAK